MKQGFIVFFNGSESRVNQTRVFLLPDNAFLVTPVEFKGKYY